MPADVVFTLHFSDKWGVEGRSSWDSLEECFAGAAQMVHTRTARPLRITKGADEIVNSMVLWDEINKRLER